MTFLLMKAGRFVVGLIVVGAVFVAIVGESDTRSLGHTAADVSAKSANIVVTDMIPTFFGGFSSDDKPAKKTEAKAKKSEN